MPFVLLCLLCARLNDVVEFSLLMDDDGNASVCDVTQSEGKPWQYAIRRIDNTKPQISIKNENENEKNGESDVIPNQEMLLSSIIDTKKRCLGRVVSETGDYGWIVPEIEHTRSVRYHVSQIQSSGVKRLVIGSHVEFTVIASLPSESYHSAHDWAFYITRPTVTMNRNMKNKNSGLLITFEKPQFKGLWLRKLEFNQDIQDKQLLFEYHPRINPNNKILNQENNTNSSDNNGKKEITVSRNKNENEFLYGIVTEYLIDRSYGFIAPLRNDISYKRYIFYIDNCHIYGNHNRKVFINDMVLFKLKSLSSSSSNRIENDDNDNNVNYKNIGNNRRQSQYDHHYYATDIRGISQSENWLLNGIHHNWTLLTSNERVLNIFDKEKNGTKTYSGIIEFEPNVVPTKGEEKLFPDLMYYESIALDRNKIQATDVKDIRRGTRVEFTIDHRSKQILDICGPNGRLITFLNGERGNFYRWRNLSCDTKLPCIEYIENKLYYGFIRDVVFEEHFGIIECISNDACYQAIYFDFQDVVAAPQVFDIESTIKPSSIVEFELVSSEKYNSPPLISSSISTHWYENPKALLQIKAKRVRSFKEEYLMENKLFDFQKHMKLLSRALKL